MSVEFTFTGLDELMRALEHLPDELALEAARVIEDAADTTAQETSSHYPIGPSRKNHEGGNLQRGVHVQIRNVGGHVSAKVISGAPHAHLFERGTKPRFTRRGYPRGAGNHGNFAPEEQRLVPRAIRNRAKMRGRLIDIVREAGFEVHES